MKASELRQLTEQELQEEYRERRTELFNLRLQQTSGQLEMPSRIRELRRNVARIKCIMNEQMKLRDSEND